MFPLCSIDVTQRPPLYWGVVGGGGRGLMGESLLSTLSPSFMFEKSVPWLKETLKKWDYRPMHTFYQ